jgi:hypothetical protein
MAWTIDEALDDDLIHLDNRNDDLGVYEFRVGELSKIVTVLLSRLPTSDRARFYRSHNIKTPAQTYQYSQNSTIWDDLPYALHQAVNGITSHYRHAVEKGLVPADSWLVES